MLYPGNFYTHKKFLDVCFKVLSFDQSTGALSISWYLNRKSGKLWIGETENYTLKKSKLKEFELIGYIHET